MIGFSTTFIIPFGKGDFKAPLIIYFHGIFAFSWIFLFVIQSLLVQNNYIKKHRVLGFFGVFIAIGITVTLVPVGLYQIEKELISRLGQTAISSIVGNVSSAILFISLVLGTVLKRHTPQLIND